MGYLFIKGYIYFINIFVLGWAIGLLGDFVLGLYGFGFLGYGIGGSWILWKKVIYKYIKNTNKKIIPVLERDLGRVINRYVKVMIK